MQNSSMGPIIIKEFGRAYILHLLHFFLAILALFLELVGGNESFLGMIGRLLIIILVYRFSFKTLHNLFYTFWTFGFVIFYLHSSGLINNLQVLATKQNDLYFVVLSCFCYLLSIALLLYELYLISSPIFYPRVKWWEYDFRYRGDIKINALIADKSFDARLSDLRREAGCLIMFENIDIGRILFITTDYQNMKLHLKAEIISKREYSIGRGITYGVRFLFDNKSEKDDFESLRIIWRNNNKLILRDKFEKLRERKK